MNIFDILNDMLDEVNEEIELFYFYTECADGLNYWRNPIGKFKMRREAKKHLETAEEIIDDYKFISHASTGE